MKMFTAVFSNPDPEAAPVFWGAFGSNQEAERAISEFIQGRPYWKRSEFTLTVHPFGVML